MTTTPHLALARVWRPGRFEDLIGQDALVRTLSNALTMGRLAQAYMLTGVRGVGKTTTARIIARAVNCVGRDPTVDPEPCGSCTHCEAIAAGRDIDVIEMDAASHTGVDDIRDVIAASHYSPSAAQYKIHIIDEVHMLSRSAFNALLKTLEEPPEHARFIFATTEIRKVPPTILSRCQRFDLRRVEGAVLSDHLSDIAKREDYTLPEESARLIARAAQGSVRDALSILDQALASTAAQDRTITPNLISDLLGLLDGAESMNLLGACLAGKGEEALAAYDRLIASSHDPIQIVQAMLESTALLTRMRISGKSPQFDLLPEAEKTTAKSLADAVSGPNLARGWQILLKGLEEMNKAPDPSEAGAMVILRLVCAADMPEPAEIIRKLTAEGSTQSASQKLATQMPEPMGQAPINSNEASLSKASVPQSATDLEALRQRPEVKIFEHQFPGTVVTPLSDSMSSNPDSQEG